MPAAATVAAPHARGKVVGTVMTGLLLGILLSRVVSGLGAAAFGWRAVYGAAAAAVALLGVAAWRWLPRFAPTTHLGYGALLASMAGLWRSQRPLRRAALAQGLLSVAFSAFWSTLAVMLHSEFHWGSAAAGAFGLAGAAGALAAPLAGRLADRRGPGLVTQLGSGLALVLFASLLAAHWLPGWAQLGLLVASAIGFDFGIQAALVAHQTLVYGLEPAARSRLNALLFTGVFIGMATGSALGALAMARWAGPAWPCWPRWPVRQRWPCAWAMRTVGPPGPERRRARQKAHGSAVFRSAEQPLVPLRAQWRLVRRGALAMSSSPPT